MHPERLRFDIKINNMPIVHKILKSCGNKHGCKITLSEDGRALEFSGDPGRKSEIIREAISAIGCGKTNQTMEGGDGAY